LPQALTYPEKSLKSLQQMKKMKIRNIKNKRKCARKSLTGKEKIRYFLGFVI